MSKESFSLEFVLAEHCTVTKKDSNQSDQPEKTQKQTPLQWNARLQATWQSSSPVPLPCCPPPGCPFPIKSLALSACVSPQTIHFRMLDKSPLLVTGRGPSSCNKSLKWGCHLLSHVQFFATSWTVAHQVPLSMEFSRQDYWSMLHFLLQGIFPTQGSNLSLRCPLHCRQILYPLSHP